jgi:hypothetical protein
MTIASRSKSSAIFHVITVLRRSQMTDIEKRVRQAAEPFGKHDIHLHFHSTHGTWTVSIADNVETVFAIGTGTTLDSGRQLLSKISGRRLAGPMAQFRIDGGFLQRVLVFDGPNPI